jgi:hypothetical protein
MKVEPKKEKRKLYMIIRSTIQEITGIFNQPPVKWVPGLSRG